MIQFFNANVDLEKLCYTSMVPFGDNGVPLGDLRRISMRDYKKMVEEGLKSYEREVKYMPIDLFQGLWIILRAPTAPCLQHTTMTSGSLAALSWADSPWCLSSSTCNDGQSLALQRRGNRRQGMEAGLKKIMQMTGIERLHTVFFLENHHMVKSEFLESTELWRFSSTRYAATCVLCCPWMQTTNISSLSAPRTQLSSVVATSCGWTVGVKRACTSWSSGS